MATPRALPTLVALTVLASVACSALPVAVPAHELDDVPQQNPTCPFIVGYNDDSNRVPRRIKTISCNSTAPSDRLRGCVELRDSILVFNKSSGASYVAQVSVGCVHWLKAGLEAERLAEAIHQA